MSRICYLSRNYQHLNSAGNKAKTDMETILASMNARNIGNNRTFYKNKAIHFILNLIGIIRAVFCISKGDILILQYPLKKYYMFLCCTANLKGAKSVTLIHDLGSFRRKKLSITQEIKRLSKSDYLIALNPSMKRWLRDNGCALPIGTLDLWDYLSESYSTTNHAEGEIFRVIYAGALSLRKNAFLSQMPDIVKNYKLDLYGNDNGELQSITASNNNITYHGFIPSDKLISSVRGHFGLVWDGSDIDGCSGDWGEYLQYNNPHKTSLYIRCGLPVFIWNKAALSPFIIENNIGIGVESLSEIEEKLSSLTHNDYQTMKQNVLRVNNLISKGHFFSHAVNEAIEKLKD